jgi:hypothetical protein
MHRNDNTAADQHHNTDQPQLADSSHTAGSLYEEPASDLDNLADIDDADSYAAGDDGGGDYA